GEAAERPDLVLRHLPERAAVAAEAAAQDAEVLHRAAQHHAGQDPERAGQITELRRERRADQRPGPAIAAKWCPKTTQRLVGTKSRPSLMRSAGVCRRASSANSRVARNAP